MTLRRLLAAIVLAAPGCPGACPEHDPIEETQAVPAMPDATMQMYLDDCHADPTTNGCVPLCDDIFTTKHPDESRFISECDLIENADGTESVHYVALFRCIGGRRPAGYRRGRPCGDPVGAYLAQQAELEHASVRAFEDLRADLVSHGAPAALRRATVRAAADEVRHARTCHALARRHGVTPRYAALVAAKPRTRRELAIDNAVEGCVREMFGAAVAGYQARAAADPAIRAAMKQIFRDEAMHAALSWRLHRWLAPRLDAGERRAVADAIAAARAELATPATEHPDLVRVAGLPDETASRAMLAQLDAQAWPGLA